MARVAYLIPQPLLPTRSGARVRFKQVHDAVAALGHEVFVVAWPETPWATEPLSETAKATSSSRWERPIRSLSRGDFEALVEWLAQQQIEVVIAYHPPALELAGWAKSQQLPLIVDTQNYEADLDMMRSQQRRWLDQFVLTLAERFYLPKADRLWTLSALDQERYRRAYRLDNVSHIPFVYPLPELSDDAVDDPEGDVVTKGCNVLFLANMNYGPNVTAARFLATEVMPVLVGLEPSAKLIIAGRRSEQWQGVFDPDHVVVLGEVDSVAATYRRANVVVAPNEEGGGIKTKVLEALAYAKALVATPKSMRGLDVTDGVHYLAAPYQAHTFAETVATILRDVPRQRRLGTAARDYMSQHHSFEVLKNAIDREFRALGII